MMGDDHSARGIERLQVLCLTIHAPFASLPREGPLFPKCLHIAKVEVVVPSQRARVALVGQDGDKPPWLVRLLRPSFEDAVSFLAQ